MRVAEDETAFSDMFKAAQLEAKKGFGDDSMYLEKYIVNPKHVEVQILADSHGNVIHLGERDCSLQRRHQKVMEEAPCQAIDDELRRKLGETAVRAAKSVNYENAGTIEFLLDKEGNFYFMEMNTRIQVEHPVTELVTGVDMIKEQIRIAAGEPLSYKQEDIVLRGHAIECRINAEDPEKKFRPSPGQIKEINLPGGNGIRVDTHIYTGYTVPPYYDSMLLKLLVHGKDRKEALAKLNSALGELVVEGVDTNIDFAYEIVSNEEYINGSVNTGFIEKHFPEYVK